MSKGSTPRGVNKAVFDTNWDRIFSEKRRDMWEHKCKHNGTHWIEKNAECNWCGEKEND